MDKSTFVAYVRDLLQDSPESNALLNGREMGDKTLNACAELALADFNATPPVITGYGIGDFPAYSILIYGTMIEALTMSGILASRNKINYNAGGVQVEINSKSTEYMNWISLLMGRYQQMKSQYKQALSMNSAYRGVSSEYLFAGLGDAVGGLRSDIIDAMN